MTPLLNAIEHFVFRRRGLILLGFLGLTIGLLWSALQIRVDASFNKSLPKAHPFIQSFTQYQTEFGGANRVLIALIAREGDMFTPEIKGCQNW